MMEKSFIFDSINGDRKYKAEDFREYFLSFIGNGVFPNPSTNLQVIEKNAMNIIIKKGKAWINGALYINTEDYIIPITPADGVLSRIDRITLRMSTLERNIKVCVKVGQFNSNPVPQQLQRDADAYEIALADIKINKGIISITQADITDLRFNNNLCGVVHGTVDQVDVTTLFNQYNDKLSQKEVAFEAEFQAWFNTIKGQLSGDVAANLSKQITDINNKLGTEELTTTKKTLTGAVNEVTSLMGEKAAKTDVGTLASLSTTNKTNLVSAVNEVNNNKVNANNYVANNAFANTTGTATSYTITLNPAPTAYTDGMQITIVPHADCGATPTLNVNGLGAITIVKQDGSAIAAGDIKAGKPLSLVRVGSNFFIRSRASKYDVGVIIPTDAVLSITANKGLMMTNINGVTMDRVDEFLYDGQYLFCTREGTNAFYVYKYTVDNIGRAKLLGYNYYSRTAMGLDAATTFTDIFICGHDATYIYIYVQISGAFVRVRKDGGFAGKVQYFTPGNSGLVSYRTCKVINGLLWLVTSSTLAKLNFDTQTIASTQQMSMYPGAETILFTHDGKAFMGFGQNGGTIAFCGDIPTTGTIPVTDIKPTLTQITEAGYPNTVLFDDYFVMRENNKNDRLHVLNLRTGSYAGYAMLPARYDSSRQYDCETTGANNQGSVYPNSGMLNEVYKSTTSSLYGYVPYSINNGVLTIGTRTDTLSGNSLNSYNPKLHHGPDIDGIVMCVPSTSSSYNSWFSTKSGYLVMK